ncbi:MAG: hypothetical protein GY839_03175 [candidate division Zixibacteria bacterium]|nr:hypothetical protein [candidate division Zixibacteria bacterium]
MEKLLNFKIAWVVTCLALAGILNNCSMVGYGAGSLCDIQTRTVNKEKLEKLERGSDVTLVLRDSTAINGSYLNLSSYDYLQKRTIFFRDSTGFKTLSLNKISRIETPQKPNAKELLAGVGLVVDIALVVCLISFCSWDGMDWSFLFEEDWLLDE